MGKSRQLSDWFLETAEVEARTPITVCGGLVDFQRFPPPKPTTELIALAKLVELRRRSMGLTPLELSQKVGVSHMEVLRLEEGVVGSHVLDQLPVIARELCLRESPLLELAGVKPDPTSRIHQAAQTFVERTASAAPSSGEFEAMAAFVRDLEAA